MKSWKRKLAAIMCVCMLFNLAAPAYGGSYDWPLPGKTARSTATAATESDTEEDEINEDMDLIDDVNTASASDADKDLDDDLASPGDWMDVELLMATMANWKAAGDQIIMNNNYRNPVPMHVGDSYDLEISKNYQYHEIQFTTDNAGVAKVDDAGEIQAVGLGEATINLVIAGWGYSDSIEIKVVDDSVEIYRQELHANGGTFENGSDYMELYSCNDFQEILFPLVERYGKQFDGWYTQAEGGTSTWYPDHYWGYPSESRTVYAHWSVQKYGVWFYNGESLFKHEQVEHESCVSEPPTIPYKQGYYFTGWMQNQTGTRIPYDFNQPVTDELYLYAGWEAATDISSATVTVQTTYPYNGEAISPQVVVKSGNIVLEQGKDYVVSNTESWIDAGNYTLTVTGIGTCCGLQSIPITIEKRSIEDAVITVEGRYTYTGGTIDPTVKVVLDGKVLEEGWNTYSTVCRSIDVGPATVTVTGRGNFTGAKDVSFEILPKLPDDKHIKILNRNDGNNIYMHPGDQYTLQVEVYPKKYAEYVSFRSSNESVAKVDDQGVVTGIGTGYVYIYAQVDWDSYYNSSDSVSFNVLSSDVKIVTLELNANGGTFEDGLTQKTYDNLKQGGYVRLSEPTHPDKLFKGWYQDAAGTELVTESSYYYPENDTVLYAGWSDAYKIVFDYDGITYNGETSETVLVEQGKPIYSLRPVLPEDVTQTDGKLFQGWRTESGELLDSYGAYKYVPTKNEKLTAEWSEDYYTITWEYNGETYNNKTSSVTYVLIGKNVNSIPSFSSNPEDYNGKLFAGWMNENGKIITSIYNYIPEKSETLTAQWTTDYYTITYDYNGVQYNGQTTKTVYILPGEKVDDYPYFSVDPSKTDGSKFLGWQNADGDFIADDDLRYYIPTRSEVITALWSDYYTVTYDANGGKYNNNNPTEYVAKGQAISAGFNPTKTGFEFVGWYEETSGKLVLNGSYIPQGDVTLVAHWEEYWTITYNANGGTYTSDGYKSDTVIKGQSVYLNTGSYGYVKEGSFLIGWCTDQDCKSEVLDREYTPTGDVELYAKWGTSCTITLDAGEGYFTGGAKKRTQLAAVGETISSFTTPNNKNATFGGWYTEDGICWTYAYIPTGDVTFHAKWIHENCHTVTFHANGAYLYDSENQQYNLFTLTQKVEDGYKVRQPSTSRNGYDCVWYMDSSCKTPYNMSAVVEKDLDLYAKWLKRIDITWDAKGGSNSSGEGQGSTWVLQGEPFSVQDVTRDGYAFDGWYTLDGEQVTDQTYVYENIYVYAKWTEGYKITLELNGGKLNKNYEEVFYVKKGERCTSIQNPIKEDAAFLEWNDESGNKVTNLNEYMPTTDTVFSAKWTEDIVTLSCYTDESYIYDSYSGGYSTSVKVNVPRGGSIPANSYIPSPYETVDKKQFAGWSLTKDGSQIIDERKYSFEKDTDLYAAWGSGWTISVDYMDGFYNTNSNRRTTYKVIRGEMLNNPRDKYMSKPGYTFAGWYTNTDYTGEKYEIPFIPTGNMMLYAKWEAVDVKKVTVIFDAGEGSTVESQQVEVGKSAVKPDNPTRSGCIFQGWYTEPQYWNRYQFNEIVYKDITLYARWLETTDLKDATVEIRGEYTYTGSEIQPVFTVKMGMQELVKNIDYTVEAVGKNIDAGENAGKIKITGAGGYTGALEFTFTIEKAELDIEAPEYTNTAVYGSTLQSLGLSEGWQWDKPDAQVGNVGTNSFKVTYKSPDNNHNDKHMSVEVTVTPCSIDGGTVRLSLNGSQVYTGEEIKPAVSSVTVDGKRIPASSYDVTYENNINAGTATVTVTGKGNYTGSASTTFTIGKADPSLIIGNKVYDAHFGDTLSQIILEEGWSWKEGTQSVGNVTNGGSRTFAADFVAGADSNYSSKEGVLLKVRVLPRKIVSGDVTLANETMVYDGKEKEPEVTVICNKVTLEKGTGKDYTVSYSDNIEIGTAKVTVTGVNNYEGTVTKTFKIISDPYDIKSAEIGLNPNPADYTGKQIKPEVTVELADKTLTSPAEYTVTYGENVEPGFGTVTVTGEGEYHGSQTVRFRILPTNYNLEAIYGDLLKDVELPDGWTWVTPEEYVGDVTGEERREFDAVYDDGDDTTEAAFKIKVVEKNIARTKITVNGEDIVYKPDIDAEPDVVVVDEELNNTTLTAGIDYKVEYQDNDHAGKSAKVIVTGIGNYTGSVDNSFEIAQADPKPEIPENDKIKNKEIHLTIKDEPFFLYASHAGDGAITFTSSDEAIFKVEKKTNDFGDEDDGELSVTGVGTAVLTITVTETANYKGATLVYDVIVSRVAISNQAIKLAQDTYVYTGSQIVPEFTVEVNGVTLTEGVDYTVSYGENVNAGEEAGTVTVTGTGDYEGTAKATFEISKAENPTSLPAAVDAIYGQKLADLALTDDWAWKNPADYVGSAGDRQHEVVLAETDNYKEKTGTVTVHVAQKQLTEAMVALEYTETVYDGTEKEPVVTVTDGELVTENDYVVTYSDNKAAGEASVLVTGAGNYSGSVKKTFEIKKAGIQPSHIVIEGTYTYDGTQQKPEPVVTVGNQVLDPETDYDVTYGANINAGENAGTVTVIGKGNYTGSAEATFDIEKGVNPAVPPVEADAVYGQKLESIPLAGGWTWKTPTAYVGNAGDQQHDVLLAETANYAEKAGMVTVHVAQKDLTDTMVTLEYTQVEYNGSEKKPAVTVTDETLITDNDYTVVYSANVELGEATVTVTGRNNYKGEVKKQFEIVQAVIWPADVAISGTYTYDGTQQRPEPAVTVHGRALEQGTDYEVAYGENIHAGTGAGAVTVTGKGNYKGSAEKTFDIKKAVSLATPPNAVSATYGQKLDSISLAGGWAWKNPDASVGNAGTNQIMAFLAESQDYLEKLAEVTVEVAPKSLTAPMVTVEESLQVYDGTGKEPAVHVKDAVELTARDYRVTYEDNIHAGTAKIVVQGTGNYRGTVNKNFRIEKADPVIVVKAGTNLVRNLGSGDFNLQAEISNGGKLIYASSNTEIAAIDETGTVTLKTAGTVTLSVTYSGDADYHAAAAEVQLTVKKRTSSGGSSSGGSSSSSSGGSSGGAGSAIQKSLPAGYTGATKVINQVEVPVYVEEGSWKQAGDGNWSFTGKDGKPAASQWVAAYNPYANLSQGQSAFDWFRFDSNGNMVTGWYTDETGNTFYMNPASDNTKGRMVVGWWLIDGVYYYFNEKPDGTRGALLRNTVTPDGYYVDEKGARVRKAEG